MLISLTTQTASACRHQFALCFEGKLSQALQARRAPVEFLGPVRLRKPLSALRARRALRRLLDSHRFDVVVCHGIWSYCVFASSIARAGLPPLLYLHDIPEPDSWYYRWAWRRPPSLCIANSEYTAKLLTNLRRQVPVRVVHPLVNPPAVSDPVAVQTLRTQWHANAEDAVILQASRFDSWKGHRNLVAALASLRDVPGWRCWIAGAPQRPEEESYKRELVRAIDSAGIASRVEFIGHRDDMETVLAACDVYCQPNETPEPFGMVFVEALYASKPVVGRALGGALEIVTPECGVLCPFGTEALVAALSGLVKSRRLREQMAAAGPARATSLCGPDAFDSGFHAALSSLRH
jgi:glycosyltransferase involved in cell wall biosynthesis